MRKFISVGHGGTRDSGATAYGVCEKDLNLQIAKKLNELLDDSFLSRTSDTYTTFAEKKRMAAKSDILISIHCNAFANTDVKGIETLHYTFSDNGKKLAKLVHNELIEATDTLNRGVKPRKDLFVLRETKPPAILVEFGFMTNKNELKLLQDEEYQWKLAEAVAEGVDKYERLAEWLESICC